MSERSFKPIEILPLIWVRMCVAVAAYFWCDGYLENDKWRFTFVEPVFLFKYVWFDWVDRPPGDGMYYVFVAGKIASVGLLVGFLTRLSALTIACTIAYVLLVERAIYVNHYYLLACISTWLALLPCDRSVSIDSKLGIASRSNLMPAWVLWLLRFQLGIPYFFGAFAKLNGDWLAGQPGDLMLRGRFGLAGIGDYDTLPETWQNVLLNSFIWGGFLYDLLIVPALLWKRTRLIAILLCLTFHLTNAFSLSIGVFPWFMLATMFIFFPARWLADRWSIAVATRLGDDLFQDDSNGRRSPNAGNLPMGRALYGLAAVYVLVQLVLPIRPALYAGDANWNERGHRFAWRMMLRNKTALLHFHVSDPNSDAFVIVPSSVVVSAMQSRRVDYHPELIHQTALQVAKTADQLGVKDAEVRPLALVCLNGREPRLLIDPETDLAAIPFGESIEEHVLNDAGPLCWPAWRVPLEEWWLQLDLPPRFDGLEGRTPEELRAFLRSLDTKKPAGG
ncbi:MAG: HTTM domain-containing protein [Planctomycetota bacterium]